MSRIRRFVGVVILLLLSIPFVLADTDTESVEVRIPDFDVRINGNKINSRVEEFPFLVYKGVTYIPMTWDMSNSLGLNSKWSNENGLTISKSKSMTVFSPKCKGSNVVNRDYVATKVSFPVTVNGNIIDNLSAEYPLLNFRNVTYFPLTYDFMKTEFGCGYAWHNETGLAIDANPDLEVIIPEAIVHTQVMTAEEFYDDNLFVSDYFKAKIMNTDMLYYSIDYNIDPNLDNYMFDLKARYYDDEGEYQHSKLLYSGAFYEYVSEPYDYVYWSWIDSTIEFSSVEFVFEFRTKNEVKALTKQMLDETDIKIEFVNSSDVTKEKIVTDGGVYIKGTNIGNLERFLEYDKDLWTYAALHAEGNTIIEFDPEKAGNQYTLSRRGSNSNSYKYGYNDPREGIWKVSEYSEILIDQNASHSRLHCFIEGEYYRNDSDYVMFLYNENKEIIKIYINKEVISIRL